MCIETWQEPEKENTNKYPQNSSRGTYTSSLVIKERLI